MSINDTKVVIDQDGIKKSGDNDLAFLHPASIIGEMVQYAVRSAIVTVASRRQQRFALPFQPVSGVINTVVIDRLTYFEPDFHIEGDRLFWDDGVLPIGTTLRFESFGDKNALAHVRLERILVNQDDLTVIHLDGTPVSKRCEVYINGRCYPETSGAFVRRNNRLIWQHPTVKLKRSDKVYVLYARTVEGATLFMQESLDVTPAGSREFGLAVEPKPPVHTRAYLRGERYFEGEDFFVNRSILTAGISMGFHHGDRLTVMSTASEGFFPKLSDEVDLPAQFFIKSTAEVKETGDTVLRLPVNPPYKGASIASVRGAGYLQGRGFTRSGRDVIWNDEYLTLKQGDDLSIFGFLQDRVGATLKLKELPVAVGYPTWDLGEKAADVRKSILFLSAKGTFGGHMYVGERWLKFIDERTIKWQGPIPLKADDRVVIAIWKDPLVASEITIHSYVATMADEGKPFGLVLPVRPKEPGAALVAMNGLRLVNPQEFIINDETFNYLLTSKLVKAGDEFVFLYR